MEDLQKKQDVGINVGTNVGINENEIVQLIQNNPKITALEIAQHLNITSRQVERLISSMKKKKIINREGSRKSGEWKIITSTKTYLTTNCYFLPSGSLGANL